MACHWGHSLTKQHLFVIRNTDITISIGASHNPRLGKDLMIIMTFTDCFTVLMKIWRRVSIKSRPRVALVALWTPTETLRWDCFREWLCVFARGIYTFAVHVYHSMRVGAADAATWWRTPRTYCVSALKPCWYNGLGEGFSLFIQNLKYKRDRVQFVFVLFFMVN